MMEWRVLSRTALPVLAGALVVTAAHFYLAGLGPDAATPWMMVDRGFDLSVVALLSLAWVGVGRMVLRRLNFSASGVIGPMVLAWGLGAGFTSHGLLLLGVLHLLTVPVVVVVLAATLVLTRNEWRALLHEMREGWRTRAAFTRLERVLLIVNGLLLLPILLSALTPPIEGDALSYQLAAPAEFLARGAIVPLFENTGANYPLGPSLLFVFGLALDSPIAAQLVHFAFGLGLMGAVYALAAEAFSRPTALLATAILWTSPVIGLEASAPLVDLGWVLYEFAAVWMFWRWHQSRARAPLILAGIAIGFAVSSKYLAFVGWGVLAVCVGVDAWLGSQRSVRAALRAVMLVNVAALLTALPWLAKNLVLLGNPLYPFFLGAYGFNGQLQKPTGAAGGLGDWVAAGMGNGLDALLAFPFNVYVHWERFDSVKNRGGPSLFFWFLPLYLFVKKNGLVTFLLVLAAVRFAVWWNLTQFVRYGLILFPLVSVICAYAASELYFNVRGRWTRPLLRIAIAVFLVIGITLQWGFFLTLREGSLAYLLGLQSQTTFLETNLHDARVTRFMNETLPRDAKVFAVGDTRVFYITRAVIGDAAHTNWADLAALGQTPDGVRRQLRALGVSHVWRSQDEIVYSKNFWNLPTPEENQIVPFETFRARYLEQMYEDDRGHTVYRLLD